MDKVSLEELHNLFLGTSTLIVDIREEQDFAAEHIPGSLNVPLSRLDERFGEIPKDGSVYVICEKGGRSIGATLLLKMKGIAAYCVSPGGVNSWKERGFPLSSD